jgi:YihY family inner membrane protein
VTKQVVSTIQEREVTFMAASISYYAFASLIPLMVLGIVVAVFVGGGQQLIIRYAEANLPKAAQDLVLSTVSAEAQAAAGGIGAVSFALTLWGALKIFRGVDVAFSRVYGSDPGGLVAQVRDGIVVLGAIGLGIAGVAVVTAAIGLLRLPFADLLGPVLLLVTLCVAFFPFYYVLPDRNLTPREALPGTVFAAVGWTVLGTVFGFYAGSAGGDNPAAAVVGAVLILLTWFYFSGILLLTGAVINAVLAGRIAETTDAADQQVQHGAGRQVGTEQMSDESDDGSAAAGVDRGRRDVEPHGAADINELEERIAELQADLAAFEEDVDERTVQKPELKRELKRYVRSKVRRSKARGWGPYLVLLYGVVLTLAAFFTFSDDLIAFVAMLVIFLSTLGLYVLFVMFGTALSVTGLPGKAVSAVRSRRD